MKRIIILFLLLLVLLGGIYYYFVGFEGNNNPEQITLEYHEKYQGSPKRLLLRFPNNIDVSDISQHYGDSELKIKLKKNNVVTIQLREFLYLGDIIEGEEDFSMFLGYLLKSHKELQNSFDLIDTNSFSIDLYFISSSSKKTYDVKVSNEDLNSLTDDALEKIEIIKKYR